MKQYIGCALALLVAGCEFKTTHNDVLDTCFMTTGVTYKKDTGMPISKIDAESLACVQELADNDNSKAQRFLANFYLTGNAVEQSNDKYIEWMKKSARLEDAQSALELGMAYITGEGTAKDFDYGQEWLDYAVQLGSTQAEEYSLLTLMNMADSDKNSQLAFEKANKLAKDGHAWAIYNLGLMYFSGVGTERDTAKAVEQFKAANNKGYLSAKLWLGMLYANGIGLPKDNKLAQDYFKKTDPQFLTIFEESQGKHENVPTAYAAYAQDDILVASRLAAFYEKHQNYAKAYEMLGVMAKTMPYMGNAMKIDYLKKGWVGGKTGELEALEKNLPNDLILAKQQKINVYGFNTMLNLFAVKGEAFSNRYSAIFYGDVMNDAALAKPYQDRLKP